MDPLSFTASVIALIQLTGTVITLLSTVKDTSKARHQCELEVKNILQLLESLKDRCEGTRSLDPWFADVRQLSSHGDLFDQFEDALKQLQHELEPAKGLKRAGKTLSWKFNTTDLERIFSVIERLKSRLQIALENDHLSVLPIVCRFQRSLIQTSLQYTFESNI
jgi:hypothetical protein